MPTQNVFLAQWIALIFFHIAVFGASGSARAQSVDAVPDSGSAIAGVASTAIANLAANDSIDGAAAILGAAGNATVAQVGTWPTGIALDPSAGAVNVDATVAPGSYSFQYQLCDLNTPPDCAVTDIFLNASASILANPDSGTIAAGTSGTPVANVAANDIVNGAPATLGSSGNSTIAVVGTWPAGIALDTATGTVSTDPTVRVGSYALTYQLCDLNMPHNCASATVSVTATASIVANPDAGTTVAGMAATPIADVTANDTVNAARAALGATGNSTIAMLGTWPPGIALNTATGSISTTAQLTAGTYTVAYQLCDLNTPADCAAATETITITPFVASIVAAPDTGTAAAGIAATPIANVAANDTVNGAPATLGNSGNATISQLGPWPNTITLNSATGAITTTASLAPGSYSVQYQLCDLNVPQNCGSTTDSVSVTATIVAVGDSGTADAGFASRPIANVAANDTINGVAATLGSPGNGVIAKVGAWPAGFSLNTTSGALSTTAAVTPGTYAMQYQLCDKSTPAHCATITDTVTVIIPAVVPTVDTGRAVAGAASKPIANVAANDTIAGLPATLGASGRATITQYGTWPPGITLNIGTGAVSTTVTVPLGTYSIPYQLCDRNVPPVCATAADTLTLYSVAIVPTQESGTADAGIASTAIANVAANDTINGAPATLGTSGNATLAAVGTWPAGFSLSTATGTVKTTTAVLAGVYSLSYQLCDKNTPPDCASAIDSVNVIVPAIVPSPESGSATAGTAATVIQNVTANDTINGAPATLGASGNATIAKSGSWPTTISLDTSTGAITTTTTTAPQVFSLSYQLCDRNVTPKCVATTDTITVLASIVANPEFGNSVAGTPSTPIVNVAANDTVNGAAARLDTPNATIAKSGAWPAGVSLSASGAVTTTAAAVPGTYSIKYQLCDKYTPAHCATATDGLTIAAAIKPAPDVGGGLTGQVSTAIANVAANDTVNGAAAKLGASGNSTIAALGSWPAGITLNSTTGAIALAQNAVAGTYPLQYMLCDKNTPQNCATTTDSVLVASPSTEVQVSTVAMGDIEFDWARDGLYCATCNYGQGNARFNWVDPSGNLWVGHMDPTSGAFTPAVGNNELVDTTAYSYITFSNGPEWGFSTQDGQVVSQLVYTRYAPGQPPGPTNAGAAFATPGPSGWTANFFPAANGPTSTGAMINTVNPEASQCNSDTAALSAFNDLLSPQNFYWESTSMAPGTAPAVTPFGSYANSVSGGKPAIRWVPCTRQLTFLAAAPPDALGNVYQQVFWYDIDSQSVQQLTSDPYPHTEAYLFQAPEFGDAYVLTTVANGNQIEVYEQTGTMSSGAPTLQLVNQITSNDPREPYIIGTEPFIHCSPTCKTFVFMKLTPVPIDANNDNLNKVANGIAVAGIDPAQPLFKLLDPAWATPTIQRMDLEYFITANGPYLYYDRNTIASSTTTFVQSGRWYVDMQLGAPSGPCVGSSAEAGMLPGC